MRMKVNLLGMKELRETLSKWFEKCPGVLSAVLYEEAEEIMGDSKENYVPVDLGSLRSSGHVQQSEKTKNSVVVKLGFGGAAAPYALVVHEDLDAKHRVGQAKYLEIPFFERTNSLAKRLEEKAESCLND